MALRLGYRTFFFSTRGQSMTVGSSNTCMAQWQASSSRASASGSLIVGPIRFSARAEGCVAEGTDLIRSRQLLPRQKSAAILVGTRHRFAEALFRRKVVFRGVGNQFHYSSHNVICCCRAWRVTALREITVSVGCLEWFDPCSVVQRRVN